MLLRIILAIFLNGCVIFSVSALEDKPRIALLTNKYYTKEAEKLSSEIVKIQNAEIDIKFVGYDFSPCSIDEDLRSYDLIVSLGRRGLQRALCYDRENPIYSIFISKSHYKSTLAKYNSSQLEAKNKKQISALYIEQSINNHALFLKAVSKFMHEPLRAGVILGENTVNSKEEILESSAKLGIDLEIYEVSESEEPADVLKSLLAEHNLILAIPDYGVFDKHNARGMLMLAFANHIPVIGYNQATTRSGALASLYTPKYKQIREASTIIAKIIKGKPLILPEEKHPDAFSIAINNTVKNRLMPELANSSVIYDILKQDLSNEE
jgi:hypothetical protein